MGPHAPIANCSACARSRRLSFEVTLSPLGALDLRESTDKCRCVDPKDVHRTDRTASTASAAARANRELLSVCMFSPSRFEVTLSPLGALDLRESTDKCRCVDQQDVHRTGRIAFYSIRGRTRQSRTAQRVHVLAVSFRIYTVAARRS